LLVRGDIVIGSILLAVAVLAVLLAAQESLRQRAAAARDRLDPGPALSPRMPYRAVRSGHANKTAASDPIEDGSRSASGRSWIRTTDLRLIRAAL
jgi:hypothetical protein